MNHWNFLFTLLLVLGICSMTGAQVNKGAWMVGGSLSMESSEGETAVKIEPQVGYFLINNLALGANFNIDFEGDETETNVGPFVRYYAFKGLFAQAGVDYGKAKDADAVIGYNGALGYSWFVNNSVAFEPTLRYGASDGVGQLYIGIGVQAFLNRD